MTDPTAAAPTADPSEPVRLGASLSKILRGERPTFIVAKSYQASTRLGEVFDALHGLWGKRLGLGTTIRMTHSTPTRAATYMASHSNVPLRLVDPELHHGPDTKFEDADPKTAADKWSFLEAMPTRPNATWTKAVLQAQRDAGATVLLSASGWVHDVKAEKTLKAQMNFVEESRSHAPNEPMMVNLAFDHRWLAESTLRDILLEEIVERNEKHWYLRFYWPIVKTRYGQLLDAAVLDGYRELAALCRDEGKSLFLPNTGLTGWVASAFGAAGFSTGQSWPEQAFARQQVIAGRKGQQRPPKVPRFFEPTILHTAEYGEHERLSAFTDHVAEADPFALEIEENGHSTEVASLHYLMAVGELQAALRTNDPRGTARKTVRRAKRFVEGLDRADQLTGANRPQHLDLWYRALT
ncbi:hypothetical protein [Curtobacterium poinsettiae]|uniref:hypothetical protein n=1 Tax=Curtobacterium poinsettiae TaxID=159612 RepID=UPI00235F3ED0|nr:hypothetical protein [Curtobacterium flaccumfaciens]MDD1386822.1 hypothetical protein [Curtobacterium flaccumfaciens pv. poinsettiae]